MKKGQIDTINPSACKTKEIEHEFTPIMSQRILDINMEMSLKMNNV